MVSLFCNCVLTPFCISSPLNITKTILYKIRTNFRFNVKNPWGINGKYDLIIFASILTRAVVDFTTKSREGFRFLPFSYLFYIQYVLDIWALNIENGTHKCIFFVYEKCLKSQPFFQLDVWKDPTQVNRPVDIQIPRDMVDIYKEKLFLDNIEFDIMITDVQKLIDESMAEISFKRSKLDARSTKSYKDYDYGIYHPADEVIVINALRYMHSESI